MNTQVVLSQLSLEDKIRLVLGQDNWHLASFPNLDIPEIMVADGPHGLRKQIDGGNQIGLADSEPSTCFPTASLSACSWDKELLYQMGQAIGEEALAHKVSVVLGPGVNIKRNPRCGRNFEYFSEDPLLAGLLGASFIKGVQSQGIGTSLKHFAANNQETRRMTSSSNIDARALRELYLKPFEIAVKQSQPWTVMASYNKINGVHSCSNPFLLTQILREEWGFKGLVVSDWGAGHERDIDLKAGMDLEMPGNGQYYLPLVKEAIEKGTLKIEELDRCALRVLELIDKSLPGLRRKFEVDQASHHALAKQVALESIVLMKNDGILPLDPQEPLLVVGELAQIARIQGSGSSRVHPILTESFLDGLRHESANFSARSGYRIHDGKDLSLIPEAVSNLTEDMTVVVFAGLTEETEVEGFDRPDLKLPPSHDALIEAVLSKTNKVIVILAGGAPIEMPWASNVAAILNGYLPGEAGGPALAELLFGKANPCGKLAETYPILAQDVPNNADYAKRSDQVDYRESVFVGYRYFDSAKKPVLFPFGHGLSYTTFDYRDLSYAENVLSFTLTNSGERAGSEIVQIYVSNQSGANFFPSHELKAFEKIHLKPKESKVIHLSLDETAFQYYDSSLERFICANGIYEIQVGASSQDLRLSLKIELHSNDPQHIDSSWKKRWFAHLNGLPTPADFEALTGIASQTGSLISKGHFTIDSSLEDLSTTLIGKVMKVFMKGMLVKATQTPKDQQDSIEFKIMVEMAMGMPLRNTMLMSQGQFPPHLAYGIIDLANGKWITGFKKITRKINP